MMTHAHLSNPWHLRCTNTIQDREFENLREISRLHLAVLEAAQIKPKTPLVQPGDGELEEQLKASSADELLLGLRLALNEQEQTILESASGHGLEAIWKRARENGAECALKRWPASGSDFADLRALLSALRESPLSGPVLVRRATAREVRMSHLQPLSPLRSRLRFEWTQGYLTALRPEIRVQPIQPHSNDPTTESHDDLKWEI